MNQTAFSLRLRRITVTAVFISIALILKTFFSISVPVFGQNGMRIGFAGVFTMLPAVLFGPWYGMAASALTDLLGYLLKPQGAYLPVMTLVVALGGFVRGSLWQLLRRVGERPLRISVTVLVVLAVIFGLWNFYALGADGIDEDFYSAAPEVVDTAGMYGISRLLVERTVSTGNPAGNLATYRIFVLAGPLGFAVLGGALLLADFLLFRRKPHGEGTEGGMLRLLLALLVSGLLVSTLNTVVLREMLYPSWKLLPFFVLWLPRALEEVFANAAKAYFVALLFGVFLRQRGLRALVWQGENG